MNTRNILHIAIALLLTACSEEVSTIATHQHPNGAIELQAGIVEGSAAAVTRAGAEDNHTTPGHLNLTSGTKITLQVSGTWTGHDPVNVEQPTTATVGDETGTANKHNELSCTPTLYWDDYGSAAEGNYNPASTMDKDNGAGVAYGRGVGLTIYGAAVDGYTLDNVKALPTALTSIADWTALSWTLYADQTSGDNIPVKKDLLISNNVKSLNDQSPDQFDCGTYKFDKRNDGKLLEFRHALSKITVNLKAGEGFAENVFVNTPEVKLTSNEAGQSNQEWPVLNGSVNVTDGTVVIPATPTRGAVTMYPTATATSGWTKTYEALVMPGSQFASDDATILRINADNNIYYVTAAKIRTAISNTHAADGAYATQAGKNYIINVIVDKTAIRVTATVANWTEVNSQEVEPVINVTADWGTGTTDLGKESFSLYRSTSLDDGYSTPTSDYYPEESVVSYSDATSSWTMTPQLYWPDHFTHYQFRGVWPRTKSITNPTNAPVVTSGDYQAIKVTNEAYVSGTFPGDLMIGRPEFDDPATTGTDENNTTVCTNNETGHTTTNLWSGGICATEGTVKLNFRYMMSQVEVFLETSGASDDDRVDLENVKVELVGVYSGADVKLGSREVVVTGTVDDYTLGDKATDTYTYPFAETSPVDRNDRGHCEIKAIVPQPLDGVKFRITITNANGTPSVTTDDTQDVYYADVAPIKKSGSSDLVAPNGKWDSGVHYVYNLHLTKTEVNVTATLTDWHKVEASEEVWF